MTANELNLQLLECLPHYSLNIVFSVLVLMLFHIKYLPHFSSVLTLLLGLVNSLVEVSSVVFNKY